MANDLTCQHCGRELGNEGAKAQHERSCDENPANQGGDRAVLARRQDGGQTAPANQGAGLAQAGAAAADSMIALTDPNADTQTQMQGIQGLAQIGGGLIQRYNEYREARNNAEEARAQSVSLEPADRYPKCGDCDYQFGPDDIGLEDEQVRCPDCNRLYDVVEIETVETEPA